MTAPTTQPHPGDIIQITDADHQWFPALLIVDEVKAWGVQAWTFVVSNERDTGTVFNRLRTGSFEVVGAAHMLPPDTAKARAASLATASQVLDEAQHR